MTTQIDVKALEAIFSADYKRPMGELSGTVKIVKAK